MRNLVATISYPGAACGRSGGGGGELTSIADAAVTCRVVDPLEEIVGNSPGIVAVREKIVRLISRVTDAHRLPPVLIQGETGTGKGLVARALHRAGPRARGPFVDVNCAAIPEALLEAEMFGFERGAFTDARQAKRGLFQAAHQGTLFLDEIGLLPAGLQAKLLKVIEERAVRRLGSTRSEAVDAWIVAATNADLNLATQDGRFREDLYHRLAVLTLALPPLRERGDDIVRLAEHLLARACRDYGLAPRSFTEDARAALVAYAWPGNVRELTNVVERVTLLTETPTVTAEMLGLAPAPPASSTSAGAATAAPEPPRPLALAVEDLERAHVLDALRATGGNVSRAASRLRISRNTLRYRMEKYGLRPGAAPPGSRHAGPARATPPSSGPAAARAEDARVAARPTVRWERRRVTILRAALVPRPGATGPLEASRALEALVDKIHSFGGRVEELSASSVVGIFGLGILEYATWRAASAALAIHRVTEQARAAGEADTGGARVALHVATLMVGRVGDAVQIEGEARREAWRVVDALLAQAEPGATLVSTGALPLLERRFDLVPAGSTDALVPEMYRLTRSERAPFETGRRVAPFVGRQRELALLRDRLTAARMDRGQIVGIVGEAGIGKSRLLYEFRQSLDGEPVTYLEAHCFEYGRATPYLPMLEMIRQNCRIAESDSPGVIAGKIRFGLDQVGMAAEQWAPYLLHLLGVTEGTEALGPMSPEAIKARSFESLRQLALRGSQRRPVVFAIEDLHWIDSMSGELIESLVESLQGVRILLVGTYRPGYQPPWMDRSDATQLAIGPLSAEDSLAVVQSVLQGEPVPAPLAGVILGKAQGNPFFLEELARSLDEHGTLDRVPDTVDEVLLARIDRLPDGPRRLVRIGSVLGREFSVRLLGEAWEEPAGLETHLRELARQEIVQEEPSAAGPTYTFRHALTQDVVYASLLEGERRRLHGMAGRALERLYAGRTDEVVELLAHHFGRSDDGETAVDYALLAAEKAQRRWANAEALAHFAAALARLDALPDTEPNRLRRIDAVLKQAEVKFALGQHAEHIHALEWIRPLVERLSDPKRQAAWYYWTGFLHSLTSGRPDVAIAHCQRAAAIADAAALDDIRAFAETCLAQAYTVAGDLKHSVESDLRALEIFEARGDVWWACRALWGLTSASNGLGRWRESLDFARRALDYGRAVSDLRLKVGGLLRLGWTHIRRGDPKAGLRCCDEALALRPIPFDAAMVGAARACGLIRTGDAAPGTAALAEALGWFEQSNLRYIRAFLAVWLAEGHLRQGAGSPAKVVLEEVLRTSREFGYRYILGVAHRLLGACLAVDDPGAAFSHLESGAKILEEIGAANELALCWVGLAELRRTAADSAGARRLLERALATFETLGTLGEPDRVRTALARLAE